MTRNECWNSVTVYAPTVEILRLRGSCIALSLDNEPPRPGGDKDGCDGEIG